MNDPIKLRAEARQMHDGVLFLRGQEFSTTDADEAAGLVAMSWASYQTKVEHEPEPESEITEPESITEVGQELPIKRGRGRPRKNPGDYQRRDLRAEK